MGALDDLADRLERAAGAMAELGPAITVAEPWPLTATYGPGPESEWGPREILAHCAEMLPYWMGEIERILDGGAEPPAFGRLETDTLRIEVIGRDRRFPARELLARVGSDAGRVATRLRELGDAEAAMLGRHPTRGDLSVRDVAERLIVGHIEGHVTQLQETIAAAR